MTQISPTVPVPTGATPDQSALRLTVEVQGAIEIAKTCGVYEGALFHLLAIYQRDKSGFIPVSCIHEVLVIAGLQP